MYPCFDLPRFVLCVARVHLLKAGGSLPVGSPDAAAVPQYGCPEGGTGGKCLLCPSTGKHVLCFSFDGRCSDPHSLKSCGYCPNVDNPAGS